MPTRASSCSSRTSRPWVITASGKGDLDKLPITAEFTAPFQATADGVAEDLTNDWHWSGKRRVQNFDLAAFGGGHVLGRVFGELAVKGDAHGFEGRGPLTAEGLHAGPFNTVFAGNYADHVVTATHMEATHIASGAHAEGAGTIRVVPGGPELDLHGTWKNFRWPLVGKDIAVQSEAGEFGLRGVRPYDVRLTGPIKPVDLDPMKVEMEGRLGSDRLTVTSANVEAFDGQATVAGEVVWSPQDRWAVTGDASDINPGRIRDDLPGKLDFHFAAEGLGFGSTDDFSVDVRNLTGRLRGSAATGSGLHRAQERRVGARSRAARARAHESVGGWRIASAFDLRFAVEAEDLSLLKQESRGKLKAPGHTARHVGRPVVNAEVHGSGIEHEGISLAAIDGRVGFRRERRASRRASTCTRAISCTTSARSPSSASASTAAPPIMSRASTRKRRACAQRRAERRVCTRPVAGNDAPAQHERQRVPQARARFTGRRDAVAGSVRFDWFCLNGEPAKLCADADWTPAKWTRRSTRMSCRFARSPRASRPRSSGPAHHQRPRVRGGDAPYRAICARTSSMRVVYTQARQRTGRAHHVRQRARHVQCVRDDADASVTASMPARPAVSIEGTLQRQRLDVALETCPER